MSDEEIYDELVESLHEGALYVPVASEDPDDEWTVIEGPGMLPYLAVFSKPEGIVAAFDGDLDPVERPGADCLAKALEGGWGIVFDLQMALSHGTLYGVLEAGADDEDEDDDGDDDDRPVRRPKHTGFDLRRYDEDDTLIVAPGQQRAPLGMRRAIHHVLQHEPDVKRAWLVLVCVDLPDEDVETSIQRGASNLFVIAETEDDAPLDGSDLVQRLAWATPPGEPIQLMIAHEDSMFSLDHMRVWPQVYPKVEETVVH